MFFNSIYTTSSNHHSIPAPYTLYLRTVRITCNNWFISYETANLYEQITYRKNYKSSPESIPPLKTTSHHKHINGRRIDSRTSVKTRYHNNITYLAYFQSALVKSFCFKTMVWNRYSHFHSNNQIFPITMLNFN